MQNPKDKLADNGLIALLDELDQEEETGEEEGRPPPPPRRRARAASATHLHGRGF